MQPVEREPVSGAIGWAWIDFFMTKHNRVSTIRFTDPPAKITDELVQCIVLGSSGKIAIEIADQADAECDIV